MKEKNKQVCLCIVIGRLERHQTLGEFSQDKEINSDFQFLLYNALHSNMHKRKKEGGKENFKRKVYIHSMYYTHGILQYTPKNWYFWTAVLEKTLESPMDSKEIQPVHPKGNQSWIFTGMLAPILWPPDAKTWLTGKDPDAGKDWRWEKGTTEDEMVRWHHRLNGHEFE